jgi:hypothetical protein
MKKLHLVVCSFEFSKHCIKHEHFAGMIDQVLVNEGLFRARNQGHLDQVRVIHYFTQIGHDREWVKISDHSLFDTIQLERGFAAGLHMAMRLQVCVVPPLTNK